MNSPEMKSVHPLLPLLAPLFRNCLKHGSGNQLLIMSQRALIPHWNLFQVSDNPPQPGPGSFRDFSFHPTGVKYQCSTDGCFWSKSVQLVNQPGTSLLFHSESRLESHFMKSLYTSALLCICTCLCFPLQQQWQTMSLQLSHVARLHWHPNTDSDLNLQHELPLSLFSWIKV